jgi:hypothetical protein
LISADALLALSVSGVLLSTALGLTVFGAFELDCAKEGCAFVAFFFAML